MYYIPLQLFGLIFFYISTNFNIFNSLYWLTDPLLNIILFSLIFCFILIG